MMKPSMQFTQTKTDCIAHQGLLTLQNHTIQTPEILFLHTHHITAPPQANILLGDSKTTTKKPTITIDGNLSLTEQKNKTELLYYPTIAPRSCHTSALHTQQTKKVPYRIIPPDKTIIATIKKSENVSLYILSHSKQVLSNQRQFIEALIALRQHIGFEKALYLPAVADPINLSLFTYMGADLFDSTAAIINARKHILLFPTGHRLLKNLTDIPCSCPACYQKKPEEMIYQFILQHNYHILIDEIRRIRNAITTGSLRNLVETRIRSDPALTAMLRILDAHYEQYYLQYSPRYRSSPLLATSSESLSRPEVKDFQQRLLTRYQKPPSTTILLLLPCSAKKPYSTSKSHRLYQQRYHHLPNAACIHEVVVTSPLGVVPKELEYMYPASHYDIPVTGEWTDAEKQMITTLMRSYLKKNQYTHIIVHLPDPLKTIIKKIIPSARLTCSDNHTTSTESLSNLSQELKDICDNKKNVKKSTRIWEHVSTIASFQFGEASAKKLCKNTTVHGRYPYYKIMNNNAQQLGMISSPTGMISLTLQGGERIFQSKQYYVTLYNDFDLKGSVFAPGVKNADDRIRRGDEVFITQDSRVCGVGRAVMTGEEMMERTSGEAIKVRHHRSTNLS